VGACVAVMAGGTGGHVFPALAVAERLRADGVDVFWIGTRRGMEARLVPERGFDMEWIGVEGLRGKGIATLALAPVRLAAALWQSGRILRRRRPAAVLGMGGFASGPGGLMARVLGLPLVIHEQNRVPGLTNQWLARIAVRVFEAFPGSFPPARRAEVCGNPVRPEIAALAPPEERLRQRLQARDRAACWCWADRWGRRPSTAPCRSHWGACPSTSDRRFATRPASVPSPSASKTTLGPVSRRR
jgi:UDP-N-acetylglucosamine--N-acetylmuramyl-(pentapeptide) pyrophosphoryl-undecaprenol N-acetylglucosamine transferase